MQDSISAQPKKDLPPTAGAKLQPLAKPSSQIMFLREVTQLMANFTQAMEKEDVSQDKRLEIENAILKARIEALNFSYNDVKKELSDYSRTINDLKEQLTAKTKQIEAMELSGGERFIALEKQLEDIRKERLNDSRRLLLLENFRQGFDMFISSHSSQNSQDGQSIAAAEAA
jgi:predicted  nucleic acid-binding Zn-ribbon protein